MSSRSTQIIGGPDREHAFVDTATNALLVKVINPSGPGSNVNIAEVGGTAIGSTVPVSGTVEINEPVSVDDNGGSLTVDGTVAVSSVGGTVEIIDGGGSITVDGTVAVSSVGGTVTVGDGGGSLTVDGTVAATQSGNWTVSVNEPVSVDDNGGSLTVDGTVAVSSVGGTVTVGDGGGSLTVDGTVATTQSGSWTVSVNEPVSVDDNGGSLTVDGTVAATQSGSWTATAVQTTHDNLNANANIQVGDADVGNGNPVPVSDAGGSLTVDGTVAATQSGSWTVSVNEPVSVDDNGGSLTVDGTVAATQSGSWTVTAVQTTHDNLNANANIQVGNTDVGNANPVPVSDAGGSLTVDGTVVVSSVNGTVTLSDSSSTQVSSVIPGTSNTELGKAWDQLFDRVDVGVPAYGVVDTTGYTIANEGNYMNLRLDAAGRLYTYVDGGVVPGTGATNLGKAEDTAHTSGSTGVMTLAVRNDSMTVFAGPTGDYIPLSTDAAGRLQIIKSGGKATYRAATTNNVAAAAGSAIFFVLSGSSTKTITIQRIVVTCPTLTAAAYHSIVLEKFSTAPTGGSATTLTKTPLDSSSAASTANLCQVYTAAPTEGTLVGTLGCQRFLALTATDLIVPGDPITWDFRNGFGEGSGIVLRSTAENIGLAFGAAPASAVTLGVEVEWIEE